MKGIEAILALALLLLSCDATGKQSVASDVSFLANPDFESFSADGKVVGWSVPGDKWRVMRGEGMNGSRGMVFDGVPFFPLGMYSTGHLSDKQLARYADSDFNCIMQYGSSTTAEMEAFQKKGLKVIYEIGSKYRTPDAGTNMVRHAIGKFARHPALLAWYIYDEQPTSALPALEARQRLVEMLDPDHPTWCAQDIFEETRYYLNACDVFGGDPYPVSAHPIDRATKAIRQEAKGLMWMRPIWQVVQAFGWNWIRKSQAKRQRRPTEAEIRNMAWQAIAGGARGLVFYSYSHYCRDDLLCREPVEVLWPEMKRIAAELKSHENTLLMAETYGIPDADLPSGVVGRIWKNGNVTWRLLVNTSASVEITAFGTTLPPLGVSLVRLKRGNFETPMRGIFETHGQNDLALSMGIMRPVGAV